MISGREEKSFRIEPCSRTPIQPRRAKNANYNKVDFDLKSIIVRNRLKVMSRSHKYKKKVARKKSKNMVGTLDTFLANVASRNKIHFCGLLNGKKGEKEYLAWHACFMVVPNKHRATIVKCEQ